MSRLSISGSGVWQHQTLDLGATQGSDDVSAEGVIMGFLDGQEDRGGPEEEDMTWGLVFEVGL